MQSLPTNGNLLSLFVLASLRLFRLHQVLIYRTHAFPQLRQFWNLLWTELTNERPYSASIDSMRLRLQKLEETNSEAQELRQKDGYQEINRVLYYQGLPFVSKAIRMELISRHHDNLLAGHLGIEKTY